MPKTASPQQTSPNPSISVDALKAVLIGMGGPDQELPSERDLVDQLNVPRSRLRRVLAELRAEGELPPAQVGRKSSRRDTTDIDEFVSVANPNDVIELRMMLEPQFARLAAIRASTIEIKRIQKAASTAKGDDYGAADLAFHREVANSSRNPLAQGIYDLLRRIGTDSRVRLAQTAPTCPKRRASRDAEHQMIAQAIAERDPDRAEALMRDHLVNVRKVIEERSRFISGTDPQGNA